MACRHFEEGALCRCSAVRGLLVPSLYERERYCLSDEPHRCPTFRARAVREEALPEEVYYAIWLPWADGDSDGGGAAACVPASVPKRHVADEAVCAEFTASE